ncbi:delta 8-(E)-sphingolipid desaturase [Bisporella sp. PMI_857]|nr:delta 8-(E)-sphingolipid desaturase [Bisporella sp. PMI_857]
MAAKNIISPCCIKDLIAEGYLIVIFEQKVLRLDAWVERHPGGKLPILHMVGKDASDHINVYHSADTLKLISRYQIGTIDEPWIDIEPPISAKPLRDTKLYDAKFKLPVESMIRSGLAKKTHSGKLPRNESKTCITTEVFTGLAEKEDIERAIRNYPSLDPETQHGINLKFRELHQRVHEQGLYDCHYSNYFIDLLRYLVLLGLFVVSFYKEYYLVSSCFLGCFWHQIMFVAHDAGHLAITHNVVFDTILGVVIADLCCGLSLGWWKSSHNVHHLVPNHPEHDPDIQNLPLLATSPTFFSSIRSTYYGSVFPWDAASGFCVGIQKYTYYPIMAIARFNLYLLSWQHLLWSLPAFTNRKLRSTPTSTLSILYFELACMAVYWYLHISILLSIPTCPTRILFVLISHSISLLLHIQITLSHFGMSTADLGPIESFAQKQLRTTMDVECPPWFDWFHGGLQFQVIHHLFPRMPKHNYREAQALVKEFCEETGIKYTIFGFVEANKFVLGRLGEIAEQVGMLKFCQK